MIAIYSPLLPIKIIAPFAAIFTSITPSVTGYRTVPAFYHSASVAIMRSIKSPFTSASHTGIRILWE